MAYRHFRNSFKFAGTSQVYSVLCVPEKRGKGKRGQFNEKGDKQKMVFITRRVRKKGMKYRVDVMNFEPTFK
jgi:hypothetical protein